jgi:hypothetical protein
MPKVFGESTIKRVTIVEDDPCNRRSLAEIVADAKFVPVPEDGPLCDLKSFTKGAMRNTDAFIFDHHLKQSQYAPFDGAEAVASLYKKSPSLLCTTWGKAYIDAIRVYRRKIPILIRTDDLNPDTIAIGFEYCIREFESDFSPSRRPWRTLVRVEDVDEQLRPPIFYVVLPGWYSSDKISLPLYLIPSGLRQNIKQGVRFHAQVNKGAENQEDLYFDNFEFD